VTVTGCLPCSGNAQLGSLPPRELITADAHWRVAHAFNTALPGWLVVLARRHVTSIADITEVEAASLGRCLVRVSAALRDVLGCPRTYVAQFAEAVPHVHFHVLPRAADLPADLVGPGVFRLLGAPGPDRVPDDEQDRIALAVREKLA
jgi:diadenosine tetraphosphate (Ap4A) HIT family hydrolase